MRGLGLIEVLVAGTIGFIIMFGVMTMMKSANEGQKRIDVKNDVQNLDNRVKNLLATDQTCKALFLDQLPNDSKIFGPTASGINQYNDSDKAYALVKLTSGEVLKSGLTFGRFKIGSLRTRLIAEVPPAGSGKYEATLVMGTDSKDGRGRDLAGGELGARNFPLIIQTEAIPESPNRRMIGCYGRGGLNPKETCETIGGRWINSITKCYFGGDLRLNQFECVDASEFDPGGPLEGAVVDHCYYKPNTSYRMKTYSCPNLPSPKYPNCECLKGSNAGKSGWQVRRNVTFLFACDQGVMIRVPDDKAYYLKENEYAEEQFLTGGKLTTSQFLQSHDTENAAMECLYDPDDSIRAFKCIQDRAVEGRTGSCVFVNGSRMYYGGKWHNNESGWIYVTNPRVPVVVGKGLNAYTKIQEAFGRKCYFVKKTQGSDTSTTGLFTSYTDPTPLPGEETNILMHLDRHKSVKECLFMGNNVTTSDPIPVTTYPFRGSYIRRYACNNAAEEIDLENLTGEALGAKPTLGKGMCWYFQNAILPNGYRNNMGVNATNRTYTGWVYLTKDLVDNVWDAIATTNVIKPLGTLTPVLNAVPCNLGVRISAQ